MSLANALRRGARDRQERAAIGLLLAIPGAVAGMRVREHIVEITAASTDEPDGISVVVWSRLYMEIIDGGVRLSPAHRQMLLVACALGDACRVNLRDAVIGLDAAEVRPLLTAIAAACGIERTKAAAIGDAAYAAAIVTAVESEQVVP
ncbi:hypothetical protein [Catenuloplanes atrovinosus]|uniref:Uncharacterized protein n=1 Tax=Catenuloplanes atrovinosus TaxID=137266 RepID=A0AAE3YS00_9ACTN|nr:hypothetical protein [Catenuloplanes atrovinosus]MDR7278903.1 hypothetical protein [Catenuloplanes atrovinosus]